MLTQVWDTVQGFDVCGFILHFLLSSVHLTMAYVHVLSRGRLFATPLTIKPGSSACGLHGHGEGERLIALESW